MYSYGIGYDFSINTLAQAASAGKSHEECVAFAARLHEDKIKLIGDRRVFKCCPKYFAETYKSAQYCKAADPATAEPNYRTVEELLANPSDVISVNGVMGDRMTRYQSRIEKL